MNSKKNTYYLYILILLILFSSTIQTQSTLLNQKESLQSTEYPLIITDDINRTLTIVDVPKSVISLSPSTTELLFSIGLDNSSIIAIDDISNYPSEVNTIEQKISIWPSVDIETVVSLSPDIVIGADIISSDDIASLESFNLVVVILGPKTIDGIIGNLNILSSIFNCTNTINSQIEDLNSNLESVRTTTANFSFNPKIYIEYFPFWTYGPNSIGDNFIELAGGINIGNELAAPYAEINAEYVIGQNPDIIFYTVGTFTTTTYESIANRTGWSVINAVKNGNIYSLDDDSLARSTVRMIDLLIEVNQIIDEFIQNYESEDPESHFSSGFLWMNFMNIIAISIIRKKIRK